MGVIETKDTLLYSNNSSYIKQIIIEIVQQKKPENISELIEITCHKTDLPTKLVTDAILQLEDEEKLFFTFDNLLGKKNFKRYIISRHASWYWASIFLVISTMFLILLPASSYYPLLFVRSVLGMCFVLFLPGFGILKSFFSKIAGKKEESLALVELFVLSLSLSIAVVIVDGLILSYLPWGIRLITLTLSLIPITVVFLTIAMFREYNARILKRKSP